MKQLLLISLGISSAFLGGNVVMAQETEDFDTLFNQCFNTPGEAGIEICDRALEIDAENRTLWTNRGVKFKNMGNAEEALESFDRAIAVDEDYSLAHYNRCAVLLNQLQQYEAAIAACDRALAGDDAWGDQSNSTWAWNNQGVALNRLGRHDEALEAYDRALEIDPSYAKAWSNRATALIDLERYEEAVEDSDRALELDPDYPQAWDNRGWALHNLERYEDALESYDRALEANPDHANAWNNKGVTLFTLERYEDALAAFEQAIAIEPDHPLAGPNIDIARQQLSQ
ncbi:MAG: tetratricopeptide repeat protein [Spirulinaceae cyanobacterium]